MKFVEGEIEVLLLGAAQDGGFPQFGCFCRNCSAVLDGAVAGDTAVSLAVIDRGAGKWFLIEAAPQLHEQWKTFGRIFKGLELAGVFLTHAHTGHYPGLLFFGKESMNTSHLPVYASAEMHDFLQTNEPWGVLYRNGNIDRVDIADGCDQELTSCLTISPQFVQHRRDFTDTCAFHIRGLQRSLFFCPDIDSWEGMQPDLVAVVTSVDVALLDATFYHDEELPGRDMSCIPHPRVVHTVALLKDVTTETEVVLIHLNHSNCLWVDSELEESLLREDGVRVGRKGMTWSL